MTRTSVSPLVHSFFRFVLVCLLAWSPLASAALERWEQLGPAEGYSRGVATVSVNAASAGKIDTLWIATQGGGVVKSTWDGSKWTAFVLDSAGLGNLNIFSLAFDFTNKVLYVGTDAGVWQAGVPSSNATALSWSQLTTTNLTCQFVLSVTVPQAGHVLAGTRCSGASSGVYHYTAGTWNRPGGVPPAAGSLGSTSGIQIYSYTGIVGTACTPACIYANTSAGVFFTNDYTNSSSTWAGLSAQPTGAEGQSNVFSSRAFTNGGVLNIASALPGGGVQRNTLPNTASSDFTTVGGAWDPGSTGPGSLPSKDLSGGLIPEGASNVTTGDFFIGVQGHGAWRSVNGVNSAAGPLTFAYLPNSDSLPQPRYVVRVRPDPITGATDSTAMEIVATVEGVYYGWTGIWQWNRIDFESNGTRTVTGTTPEILIDPVDHATAYAATSSAVYRIKDRSGQKAQKFDLPGIPEIGQVITKHRLAIDATNGNKTLYIGTSGAVYRAGCDDSGCSSEGTANGSSYPGGPNSLPNLSGVVPGILTDPNSSGPLPIYVFTDRRYPGETIGRGVWKSTDGGNSWTDFTGTLGTVGGSNISQQHIFSAAITADGTLIVGSRAGLFMSPTSSPNWTAVSSPLPTDAGTAAIIADIKADDNNVYVGYYTQNGAGVAGASTGLYTGTSTTCCTKNGTFPAGVKLASLAVTHPGSAVTPTIWVGATDDATGGIYRSNDGGTTWLVSNNKLTNKQISSFATVPSPTTGVPSAIAAVSTNGGGIFLRQVQNGPDFNNDGYADIEWRKTNGSNAVWLMQGLKLQAADLTNSAITSWTLVGRGDFDGDGQTDLLWRNTTTGANAMWLMEGTSVKSAATLSTVGTTWSVAGIGDFDGNGKSDILWRNTSGNDTIWFMNGTSTSGIVNTNTVSTAYGVAGIGDFNNDGKSDIFWRNPSTGANIIWLMNGAVLVSSIPTNTVAAAGWQVAGIGDFDADGYSDILWHNTSTFDNVLWLMNGGSIKVNSAINKVADANWSIVGIGDFNGDFISDILWRNASTGANYTWTMNAFNIQSTCGAMGCQSGYLPGVPDATWSISNP